MDLEIIIVGLVSQKEKDKYPKMSLTGRIYKFLQMNYFTEQIQTHRLRKPTSDDQKGKVGRGIK